MIYDGRSRSLTGAWIETDAAITSLSFCAVAPLRGRGLKLPIDAARDVLLPSLPYGGVD